MNLTKQKPWGDKHAFLHKLRPRYPLPNRLVVAEMRLGRKRPVQSISEIPVSKGIITTEEKKLCPGWSVSFLGRWCSSSQIRCWFWRARRSKSKRRLTLVDGNHLAAQLEVCHDWSMRGRVRTRRWNEGVGEKRGWDLAGGDSRWRLRTATRWCQELDLGVCLLRFCVCDLFWGGNILSRIDH